MPKNGYQNCKEIMEIIKSHGDLNEVPVHQIQNIIREHIGLDPRTVKFYIKNLQELGFIKTKNHAVFKVTGK